MERLCSWCSWLCVDVRFLVGIWCRGLRFLVDVKVVFLVFLVVWRCKVFGVGILVWLEEFWLMEWVCFWCGEGLYL